MIRLVLCCLHSPSVTSPTQSGLLHIWYLKCVTIDGPSESVIVSYTKSRSRSQFHRSGSTHLQDRGQFLLYTKSEKCRSLTEGRRDSSSRRLRTPWIPLFVGAVCCILDEMISGKGKVGNRDISADRPPYSLFYTALYLSP